MFAESMLDFSVLGRIYQTQPCELQLCSLLQGALPIPCAARVVAARKGNTVYGAMLLSFHMLASSLGLTLGSVQHLCLQGVSGPSTMGSRSCLCQAGLGA